MTSEAAIATVIAALEHLQIRYLRGGAFISNSYGIP